jgi:outer membrane protein assembly factor BamA
MKSSWSALYLCLAIPALSQEAAFPLESVSIEGSIIPQPAIVEITGLRVNSAISKAGIQEACYKLQETGLFASVSYRYAPGPKKGYALTIVLADQTDLAAAVIDVPGADENEVWQWLSRRFGRFDRQVPQAEPAQRYLAREIEQHLGDKMRGQHMTVRMETDIKTRALILSFEPEVLPRVQSVAFTGNQAVPSAELASALNGVVLNSDYTSRRFASAVELNLRPVYEEHGYYRVQFAPGGPEFKDGGLAVQVAIQEGAPYTLGKVDLDGADLPADRMMSAAKLPIGALANWKQIQTGIWDMERVVKRTGFFEAVATPDRVYDDSAHILNLRVRIKKGPLYRFGEVRMTGLSGELETQARASWKPASGDPYDYAYPSEFLRAFSRSADLRGFRKIDAKTRRGPVDHVMDIELVFEPR